MALGPLDDRVASSAPTDVKKCDPPVVAPRQEDLYYALRDAQSARAPAYMVVFDQGTQKDVPSRTVLLRGDGPVHIGRDKTNEVILKDPAVSGIHCRVYESGGQFRIEHLSKTNKTVVAGAAVSAESALANGDKVVIGDTVAWFYRL